MYTCIVSPVTIKILYVWLKYFYQSLAYFFLLNCIPSTVGFFFESKESIHRIVNFNKEMV